MTLRKDVSRLRAAVEASLPAPVAPITPDDLAAIERDVMMALDEDPAAVARSMTDEELVEEIQSRDAMAAMLEREWLEPRASVWSSRQRPAYVAELVARGVDAAELAKIDEQHAQHERAAQDTQ